MKKISSLFLILALLLSLCACGKPAAEVVVLTEVPIMAEPIKPEAQPETSPEATPEPTPEPTPVPIQPELPVVVDEALNEILDAITSSVQPGSSGCSLRAANCAARLLDWGYATELGDDEIYSAVGSWLDMQDDEHLVMFFDSFYMVYDASYDLRGENGEGLMADAGIHSEAYPWNEQAARAVEMVCYGCGLR